MDSVIIDRFLRKLTATINPKPRLIPEVGSVAEARVLTIKLARALERNRLDFSIILPSEIRRIEGIPTIVDCEPDEYIYAANPSYAKLLGIIARMKTCPPEVLTEGRFGHRSLVFMLAQQMAGPFLNYYDDNFWFVNPTIKEHESMHSFTLTNRVESRIQSKALAWHPFLLDNQGKLDFLMKMCTLLESRQNKIDTFNSAIMENKVNWPQSQRRYVNTESVVRTPAVLNIFTSSSGNPAWVKASNFGILRAIRNNLVHRDRKGEPDCRRVAAIYEFSDSFFIDLFRIAVGMCVFTSEHIKMFNLC